MRASQAAAPTRRGGANTLIEPARILYVDFLGKKLPKGIGQRGPSAAYAGAKWLLVSGRFADEESPALLWVGALVTRAEGLVVNFLAEALVELGLDGGERWWLHSDRAPELGGRAVKDFLVRSNGVQLRGTSHRSTTHSREESLVKRVVAGTRAALVEAGLPS